MNTKHYPLSVVTDCRYFYFAPIRYVNWYGYSTTKNTIQQQQQQQTTTAANNSLLSTTSWMYSMVSIVNRFVLTIDVYVRNAWRFDKMTHIKLGRFSNITSSEKHAHTSMANSYAIGAANPPNMIKFGISITLALNKLIFIRFLLHKCKNFKRNRQVTSTSTCSLLLWPLCPSIVSRLIHTLRLFTIIWMHVLNSLCVSTRCVCDSNDKSFQSDWVF